MIKPYLDKIQAIFIATQKHYKQNIQGGVGAEKRQDFTKALLEIEQLVGQRIEGDLLEFLEWSCLMPIGRVPFLPFVDGGESFEVWSNQAPLIAIHAQPNRTKIGGSLQIMFGHFIDKAGKKSFTVVVDMLGRATDQPGSVLIEYGIEPGVYFGQDFDESMPVERITIASDIVEFAQKYLEFLQTLKPHEHSNAKLEKLLSDHKKLFAFVGKYNWDDGREAMEYLAKSPKCDQATALLIYWLSAPYQYNDETDKELGMLPYLIEENFLQGKYQTSENTFDPADNQIANFIAEYERVSDRKREIPEEMLKLTV